jgi:hypothetical protein
MTIANPTFTKEKSSPYCLINDTDQFFPLLKSSNKAQYQLPSYLTVNNKRDTIVMLEKIEPFLIEGFLLRLWCLQSRGPPTISLLYGLEPFTFTLIPKI